MQKHNAQVPRSHEPGTFHIIHLPVPGKLAADDPGIAGHKGNAQRQNDVVLAEAQQGDEHQSQQDAGKRRHRVVDAHQRLVQPAAEISGEGPHQRSHRRADHHGGGTNEEGGAGTGQHPAENIPAEVVRAEQVPQAWGRELFTAGHGRGGIGGPHAAQQRQSRHKPRQDQTRPQIVILFFVQQQGRSLPSIAAAVSGPAAG